MAVERWYWTNSCHFCRQGQPTIMINTDLNRLYFHCGECEWGWYEPKGPTFLTLVEPGDARPATLAEIQAVGWETVIDGYTDEPSPFKVLSCVILPIAAQWIREFLLRSAFAWAPASWHHVGAV